jgi:hypothetical protein
VGAATRSNNQNRKQHLGAWVDHLFNGHAGDCTEYDRTSRVDKGSGGGNDLVGTGPEDGEERRIAVVSFQARLMIERPQC